MKKKNDEQSVGSSIFAIGICAIAVAVTLQISEFSETGWILALLPLVGVGYGVYSAIHASKANAYNQKRDNLQANFSKGIQYDSSYGTEKCKLYYNKSQKRTILASSNSVTTNHETIENFELSVYVETDTYMVAFDANNQKLIRFTGNDGVLNHKIYDVKPRLEQIKATVHPIVPSIKSYNNYAFVTDDVNEFVIIVRPDTIDVLKYSDIVSITYEENGKDIYNKSLGGAVVGGLLFGGVGAIVGSNVSQTTSNKQIKYMSIKILVKSTSAPTIILDIYKEGKDGDLIDTKQDVYKRIYERLMGEVTGIKDIFSIIIDIVDKKEVGAAQSSSTISVADELSKLASLRSSGILSDEEFNQQKAKLLHS